MNSRNKKRLALALVISFIVSLQSFLSSFTYFKIPKSALLRKSEFPELNLAISEKKPILIIGRPVSCSNADRLEATLNNIIIKRGLDDKIVKLVISGSVSTWPKDPMNNIMSKCELVCIFNPTTRSVTNFKNLENETLMEIVFDEALHD